ncbi:STIP1 y and U box-containing protein 1 [Mortierella sp. AD011]|nr:STIP1 y and U box-containing protein 1 [Mortierella sp. AD010]KAF9402106.1 STIP1 y and U box-containing protein 1 [Mortierella sp. AD011]
MTSYLTAEQHKLKGNEYFKNKAYDDAIQEYSTAILERFTNVVADCERVVELDPKSVKGYYFMGKAQLELGQPSEAYSRLKKSYELALDQRSSFIKDIVMIISEAKKQKWIEDERRKLSQVSETYHYLSGLVEQDIQRQLEALDKGASDYQENIAYLRSERDERLRQLEILLQRAGTPDQYVKPHIQLDQSKAPLISPESSPQLPKVDGKQDSHQEEAPFQVREVPDYFLDKITFEFMHDPVISTKSGISYERSTLLEHFSYGRMFDPVAQVPLTEHDIVPNRALKEACDDFLSKNGWAVDY